MNKQDGKEKQQAASLQQDQKFPSQQGQKAGQASGQQQGNGQRTQEGRSSERSGSAKGSMQGGSERVEALREHAHEHFPTAHTHDDTNLHQPGHFHDHVGQHVHREHQPQTRNMSHIKGWGADLDHKNRPAYPMERTPPRLENVSFDPPSDQPVNIEVYHSTERPGLTPVFGTSSPPSGLSGRLRKTAYGISENDVRRWFLLMLADRVNMVEGIGQDIAGGHVPNVFAEMGWKAELKHAPARLATKVAVTGAVIGLAVWLMKRKK